MSGDTDVEGVDHVVHPFLLCLRLLLSYYQPSTLVSPPSMIRLAPVTYSEASEAR